MKKRKVWEEWKQVNINKVKYLEAKREDWKAIYQARCEAKKNRFVDVSWKHDHK